MFEPESYFYAVNRRPIANEDIEENFDISSSSLMVESQKRYCSERVIIAANDQGTKNEDIYFNEEKNSAAFIYLPSYTNDTPVVIVLMGTKDNHAIISLTATDFMNISSEGPRKFYNLDKSEDNSLDYTGIGDSKSYQVIEYIVKEFEVDSSRTITNLALDFLAENEEGEISEGSIRHNSIVPINLERPYNP